MAPPKPGGGKVQLFRPHPEGIWRCSCGYENRYLSVVAHRRGYAKNPKKWATCAGGFEMIQAGPTLYDERYVQREEPELAPVEAPGDPSAEGPPDDLLEIEHTLSFPAPTTADELSPDDAESLAQRLNAQKSHDEPDPFGFDSVEEYPLGDEQFRVEPPSDTTEPSQAREVVSLPVIVRLMYDYCKGQGWQQGTGSLSDFVTDILLDHFGNCWGLMVVVAKRDELEVARTNGRPK